jgi:hypothetical protein
MYMAEQTLRQELMFILYEAKAKQAKGNNLSAVLFCLKILAKLR